ncbi:MAG: glutathione S-transferase N-terminal domain-containing protein [Gammaproteobacteria bacterium]|nr:glutathione S-transferase N-terminal domain-containing protein [Gammaproteobacteria bacterium]
MKLFFRIFFKTLRFILEPFILLWDKLSVPKGIERSAEDQEAMDQRTGNLSLYQFSSCPFCIKVRRQIKRQSLKIPLLDAQHDQQYREALLTGGGEVKVPCLQIVSDSGEVTWMYESNDIIQYLQDNFS